MSTRELHRLEVFSRVQGEALRLVDAAEMLTLGYRQTKRLWRRYRLEGARGLQHRSAGRESHRAKPRTFREQVLGLLREKYSGGPEEPRFGPTLAAEHSAEEDGLHIDEGTLRRWMLEHGLWMRTRGHFVLPFPRNPMCIRKSRVVFPRYPLPRVRAVSKRALSSPPTHYSLPHYPLSSPFVFITLRIALPTIPLF